MRPSSISTESPGGPQLHVSKSSYSSWAKHSVEPAPECASVPLPVRPKAHPLSIRSRVLISECDFHAVGGSEHGVFPAWGLFPLRLAFFASFFFPPAESAWYIYIKESKKDQRKPLLMLTRI